MKNSSLVSYSKNQRGFTLIELLVVIIIVGILATVALVYINPVEYINRSNDSKRMAEMKTISNAILRDIADNKISVTANISVRSDVTATSRSSSGSGWVSFSTTASAALTTGGYKLGGLPVLPIDPVNGPVGSPPVNHFYKFCTNAVGEYEVVTRLQSSQNDTIESNDGGNQPGMYEVGTNLSISTCDTL